MRKSDALTGLVHNIYLCAMRCNSSFFIKIRQLRIKNYCCVKFATPFTSFNNIVLLICGNFSLCINIYIFYFRIDHIILLMFSLYLRY